MVDHLARAAKAGVTWPLPEDLDDKPRCENSGTGDRNRPEWVIAFSEIRTRPFLPVLP
jgi:hypothetical protein